MIRIVLWSLVLIFVALIAAAPSSQPAGIDDRLPVPAFLNMPKTAPSPGGAWPVVRAFPKLTFQDPLFLTGSPRSNRIYVLEREGRIWSFENDQNTDQKTLVLDLSARTQGWDDCGLLGLAFHPDFGKADSPNRGYFYIWYNRSEHPTSGPGRPPSSDLTTHDRLSRFTMPDGQLVADAASEQQLIDQEDRNLYHNGGGLFFGPDGFLYLSLGDEGGGGDGFDNSQYLDKSLFSGVLRLDVNCDPKKSHAPTTQPKRGSTSNYFIPNDNPWTTEAKNLGEFWCVGLRNPHRMTLDPKTNSIWAGDVGQDRYEEIDIIEKGRNYQWAFREGFHDYNKRRPTTVSGIETPPYYEYPHENGNTCIIGGYVYRGTKLKDLAGKYIFADNTSGRIFSIETDASHPVPTQLATMPRPGYSGISSFGVDNNGELFMCQLGANDGALFQLGLPETEIPKPLPVTLSKTGAFTDVASLSPAAGLVPYTVNAPLWSDGAQKTRWIGLPTNQTIKFSPTGSFKFPNGTTFVKHFDLPVDARDPSRVRRLETRILVRDSKGGAYGATYRWRDDDSDADLLAGAAIGEVPVALADKIGTFSGVDVGDPTSKGKSQAIGETGVDISAGGTDIFGTSDQFHFAHQSIKGDFDVRLRVESIAAASAYTKAGLMARQTLDANSRYVFALAYANNDNPPNGQGYDLQSRDDNGGKAHSVHPDVKISFPNAWLRLRRQRNTFTASCSNDAIHWTTLGIQNCDMPDTIFVGLALTAHDGQKTAEAHFRDLAKMRMQYWYFPSPQDCMTCHTQQAGNVLGVNARQLNGDHVYPSGITDNQLRTWSHLGLFDKKLDDETIAKTAKLVPLTDDTASLELRARSYLDSNCAQCHLPGGAAGTFDARFDTPFDKQNLINSDVRNLAGVKNGRTIVAGEPDRSVILRRIATERDGRMPPLARNQRDHTAVATIREWILSMKPTTQPATAPSN